MKEKLIRRDKFLKEIGMSDILCKFAAHIADFTEKHNLSDEQNVKLITRIYYDLNILESIDRDDFVQRIFAQIDDALECYSEIKSSMLRDKT